MKIISYSNPSKEGIELEFDRKVKIVGGGIESNKRWLSWDKIGECLDKLFKQSECKDCFYMENECEHELDTGEFCVGKSGFNADRQHDQALLQLLIDKIEELYNNEYSNSHWVKSYRDSLISMLKQVSCSAKEESDV